MPQTNIIDCVSTPSANRALIRILTGLFLCFYGSRLLATTHDDWLVRPWQNDDGLPDNSVNGITQTADGYLWIGTPTGLARFDGVRFEGFSLTNVVAPPNRGIVTMLRGARGALWLAMDRGGVVKLDGAQSRSFTDGLPKFIPNGLAEDAEGGIWIAYRGGNVFHIKDGKAVAVTVHDGLPDGTDICALATDNRGRIWFAKAGQVGILKNGTFQTLQRLATRPMRLAAGRDGGVWVSCGAELFKCTVAGPLEKYGAFSPQEADSLTVTSMLEDHAGAVWIGTSFNGLFRHGSEGFETIPTSHQAILSLADDNEGNIWVGTFGGGLDRIRRRAITLEGVEDGLPFSSIQSICEAQDGTIWAATQNGVLVHKVDGKWNPVPTSDQWPGNATCLAVDEQGALWIGTHQHGIFCWRDGRFVDRRDAGLLATKTFHTILAGKDGDLWLGQEMPTAILHLHDGKLDTFVAPPDSRIIRAMVQDGSGRIWAGTSKGVLLKIEDGKLTEVTPRPAQELASIRCLYTTPDGALWIGFAGWGIGCMKDGHYAEINSEQGLYDDYISQIISDENGWLWLGSNRGIFKVRQSELESAAAGRLSRVRSVHYGRGDGLPSLQGTFGDSPDVLRSRDGRLWLPMQTALVVVNPLLLNETLTAPPVLLTRISVDDHVIARYGGIIPNAETTGKILDLALTHDKVRLPPGYHHVEFEFAALNFNAPENIEFRHQLTGLEDDWVDSGNLRTASYPRLSSGPYAFQVTACNGDGDWNKTGAQFSFVIAPFFWQTWWFRLTVLTLFTGSIIAGVRYVSFRRLHRRLRQLEAQAALQKERTRIAKDIHDDLGANLTQIAFLGELAQQDRDKPEQAAERISKISETARQAIKSLDEIVWAVNPRNDTLAHLLDYAGQFSVDYLRLAGIRCRLDFPEQIPVRELSTDLRHNLFLVVKEALHNIVKHSAATEVWLRVVFNPSALDLVIEDNGRGFTNAPNDALADGLRNMEQRLKDIGGRCRVESQPGQGTKVLIHLPWSEN